MIYICGLAILFLSSLPVVQDWGVSLTGLLLSLFLIVIVTGGIKTNVSSLFAEQYTGPIGTIRVLKSGEIVAVDRDLTLQRLGIVRFWIHDQVLNCKKDIHNIFLFVNVDSFAALASTMIEQKYGFLTI